MITRSRRTCCARQALRRHAHKARRATRTPKTRDFEARSCLATALSRLHLRQNHRVRAMQSCTDARISRRLALANAFRSLACACIRAKLHHALSVRIAVRCVALQPASCNRCTCCHLRCSTAMPTNDPRVRALHAPTQHPTNCVTNLYRQFSRRNRRVTSLFEQRRCEVQWRRMCV